MNREIKFRGKNEDNKWVYGSGIARVQENTYDTNEYEMVNCINYDELDNFEPSFYWESIDINTLGQFTGLKDKNGKEIYEEDIVRIKYRETTITGIIEYSGYGFFCSTDADTWELDEYYEIEVIGNIYDNLELLKENNNG